MLQPKVCILTLLSCQIFSIADWCISFLMHIFETILWFFSLASNYNNRISQQSLFFFAFCSMLFSCVSTHPPPPFYYSSPLVFLTLSLLIDFADSPPKCIFISDLTSHMHIYSFFFSFLFLLLLSSLFITHPFDSDFADHNLKMILGFFWTLFKRFKISTIKEGGMIDGKRGA